MHKKNKFYSEGSISILARNKKINIPQKCWNLSDSISPKKMQEIKSSKSYNVCFDSKFLILFFTFFSRMLFDLESLIQDSKCCVNNIEIENGPM